MKIKARLAISADGHVTTPAGWPAPTADPTFAPGQSHGIVEFLSTCEQALMGMGTFALAPDASPWPDLDVFVLGSSRPEGTADRVVIEHDPATLLERLRAANRGGDVHLVGGPKTIEAFRALGALDELHLVVLPQFFGDGLRLTPDLSTDAELTFVSSRPLEGGSVEIVYAT